MVCDFNERGEVNATEIRLRQCTCSKALEDTADAYGEAQGPWQLGGY